MHGLLRHTVVGVLAAFVLSAGLIGVHQTPRFTARAQATPSVLQADTTERDTVEESAAAEDTTQRRADVAADSLVATMIDSMRVQRLYGNVQVDQDSTRIRSERAVRFLQQREYLFTGNVVIFERGDTLIADSVRYDETRKVGTARGNVRLTDGDLFVRAPSGQYFTQEKRSVFQEGVTLVDSASTLTSDEGEYFSEAGRAEFYGDVRFEDNDTYLEADSVTYFRSTGNTIARGRVFIRRKGGETSTASADTTTRTFLFGDFARNEKTENESRVRGNALLIQIRADSVGAPEDTLLVRARRLRSSRIDSLRRLIAIDSVRIWQQDIAATADSVVYDRVAQGDTLQREETRLYENPITWFEGSQVSGDTIRVKARGRSVDTVHVYGNAFAAQRDTTLDKINQLKGRSITAYFREDSLRRIDTAPNAQTIRFLKNDQGELDGAFKASADQIVMWFRSGEIRRVGVYRGVKSEVYGRNLGPIPEPFQLEGFRWVPDQQPTKAGLMRDDRIQGRLRGNVLVVRPVSEPEEVPSRSVTNQ